MNTEIEVPISDFTGRIIVNIKVTGMKVFKLRLWLGGAFIKLGLWIARLPSKWEDVEEGV